MSYQYRCIFTLWSSASDIKSPPLSFSLFSSAPYHSLIFHYHHILRLTLFVSLSSPLALCLPFSLFRIWISILGRILSTGRTSSNSWCNRDCASVRSYQSNSFSLIEASFSQLFDASPAFLKRAFGLQYFKEIFSLFWLLISFIFFFLSYHHHHHYQTSSWSHISSASYLSLFYLNTLFLPLLHYFSLTLSLLYTFSSFSVIVPPAFFLSWLLPSFSHTFSTYSCTPFLIPHPYSLLILTPLPLSFPHPSHSTPRSSLLLLRSKLWQGYRRGTPNLSKYVHIGRCCSSLFCILLSVSTPFAAVL